MSAIGGIVQRDGRPCDLPLLERLARLLAHRSPDGTSTWHRGATGLVHGRLTITPESLHEIQPFVEDEISITFDGRLDNRAELLSALGADGADLVETGDSAIVARLYRKFDVGCVDRLLGDFAFAIWDAPRQRLVGARDHFGVRPFCYRVSEDRVAVASETGALARYDGHMPPPNEGMVAEHLFGTVTSQSDTLFRDIFRLPSAHVLVVDRHGVQVRQYWSPDLCHEIHYRDNEEYVEALRDLLQRAVKARLRVSGPVGVSLSGGVDSSSVTGLAAEMCARRAAPAAHVEAFSVLDPGEGDESAFWSQVVERWQIPSAVVSTGPLAPGQLAEEASFFFDVPNAPAAAMTDRLRVRMRERGVRVALTGSGADEYLGTSTWAYADLLKRGQLTALAHRLRSDAGRGDFCGWKAAAKAAVWPNVPTRLQQLVRRAVRTDITPDTMDRGFCERAGLRDRLARHTIDLPFTSFERYDTWHEGAAGGGIYLTELIERSAARLGVEMWHPFIDRRVIEFALALPGYQLWREGRPKDLLRRAMAPYLPPAVATRLSSPAGPHLLLAGFESEGGRSLFEHMTISGFGWVREDALAAKFDRMTALYRAGDPGFVQPAVTLWRAAAVELWARAITSQTVIQ